MEENCKEKVFHIGDILSITTGCLLSLDHMDGIYNILDFMEGLSHLTHQLPNAARRCKKFILSQYPQLEGVSIQGVTKENLKTLLNEKTKELGIEEFLPINRECSLVGELCLFDGLEKEEKI